MVRKAKEIDDNFFIKYGPEEKSYESVYHNYSAIDDCLWIFKTEDAPKLKRVLVFGSATGIVLKDFYDAFGILAFGCEINKFAASQTPQKFKKKVKVMDMRDYVKDALKQKMVFDLGFSNSFQYLEEDDISSFFEDMSKVCRFVHFHSSFVGDSARDPYRKTFKTYEWWNEKLVDAGFEELRNIWGHKTYLWKSKKLSVKNTLNSSNLTYRTSNES
jgi:hypothetical protein